MEAKKTIIQLKENYYTLLQLLDTVCKRKNTKIHEYDEKTTTSIMFLATSNT